MTSAVHPPAALPVESMAGRSASKSVVSGLVLVALGVLGAMTVHQWFDALAVIVAAVLAGVIIGNVGLANADTQPGLSFASKSILRLGIVLLGLRLSFGDVAGLGFATLLVIVATVTTTFFGVQLLGRRMGLSPGMSLLVASGFSICGNSAIASVKGVSNAQEEEVAAAVGLVTLCGTAAIVVVPALGSALGMTDMQLGVWTGAGVQDTAQVIAVASAAGPAVLAIATAVKLTRVLLLAPIVAGVSVWNRRTGQVDAGSRAPAMLPLFVVGFVAAMLLRTSGFLPARALDAGRTIEHCALAAGMVGLGSSVRVDRLRLLGIKPLLLGAFAWLLVGGISLAALNLLGV